MAEAKLTSGGAKSEGANPRLHFSQRPRDVFDSGRHKSFDGLRTKTSELIRFQVWLVNMYVRDTIHYCK